MPDDQFYELLGDDGEFIEPIDSRYGVYSIYRHGYRLRIFTAILSMFACVIVAVALWYF